MGREVLTTQRQNFWKEAYLKEAVIRFNWFRQNAQPSKARGPRRDKQKPKEKIKLPAISEVLLKVAEEKEKTEAVKERLKQLSEEDKGGLPDFDMKPVTPRVRSLLYSGISEEEEGRYKYLRERCKIKPEEKYVHPLTTNWNYGWKLGNVDPGQRSMYPRCRLVKDTFFRRNGAFSLLDPHDTVSC